MPTTQASYVNPYINATGHNAADKDRAAKPGSSPRGGKTDRTRRQRLGHEYDE